MRTWLALSVALMLLPESVAGAEEPDAGAPDASACSRAPDHDRALKAQDIAAKLMAVTDGAPMQGKQSLDTIKTAPASVRQVVAMVRCDEPALSPAELRAAQGFEAKASAWADAKERALATEEKTRGEVVMPLCQAVWGRDNAQAAIDREKSNPSGVVDLRELHGQGETLRYYREQIAALTPAYVAARHHAFTRWQDEGVCVAEASKPDGS